ncbi:MAG: S-methyl-5'-thioadenosine phosphorylase [Candidatus Omnitrophica bacterium]|nr:S-methyl-5'-thioadenosine phosphorylase [Candidatus Omnitrophota bacterium]
MIGVMGGSGLYHIDGMDIKQRKRITTPFGNPSGEFIIGKLEGSDIAFLPRHDRGHVISPTKINYRANIYGMKQLGVDRIISITACGSLKEELKPMDFVIPLQFVDRTNQARQYTFFDDGIVAHISFAHPICEDFADIVYEAAAGEGLNVHLGGTYINMEGPQFSTLAESNLYRSWGMDIIGMTNMTEARLAREAEICYVSLASVTDYDCWRETSESVNVDMIVANLTKNVENAKKILKKVITLISGERTCACKDALKYAILTDPRFISEKTKDRLSLIIGKYVK